MINDNQFLSYQEIVQKIISAIDKLLLIGGKFQDQQYGRKYSYFLTGKVVRPYPKDNIITGSYSIQATQPENISTSYSIYFSEEAQVLNSVDVTKAIAGKATASFVNNDLETTEGIKTLKEIQEIINKLVEIAAKVNVEEVR